ncbi:MAG: leucine-rich repeat protein [Bacteroidales bacterium]|nr:leucine-rich repeat protein [Bacteroidales bacterium]
MGTNSVLRIRNWHREGIIQSTSYNSNYKFITIPDELDGQTIKGIKALSENGIFSHKGIYELTLPTTFEELCFAAFSSNNLKSIDLSRCENLHTIGQSAFYSNSITNLVIPASVTSLGYFFCLNQNHHTTNINPLFPTYPGCHAYKKRL